MREIKFRAWHLLDRYMHSGGDLCITMEGEVIGWLQKRGQEKMWKIMQYTGIKDKHGEEIYEGDILKGVSKNSVVNWNEQIMQWCANTLMLWAFNEPEIIGNIYQNPELLK